MRRCYCGAPMALTYCTADLRRWIALYGEGTASGAMRAAIETMKKQERDDAPQA